MEDTDNRSSEELENAYWKAIQDENMDCDMKILKSMKWKEHNVWLSIENQFNYKAFYDLAVSKDVTFPTTFKIGDEYYTFTEFSDLKDFYLSCLAHIEACLAVCWQNKKAIADLYEPLIATAKENEAKEVLL